LGEAIALFIERQYTMSSDFPWRAVLQSLISLYFIVAAWYHYKNTKRLEGENKSLKKELSAQKEHWIPLVVKFHFTTSYRIDKGDSPWYFVYLEYHEGSKTFRPSEDKKIYPISIEEAGAITLLARYTRLQEEGDSRLEIAGGLYHFG
jgi:hypothetical protein